jgi:hypothetical protein
MPALVQIVPNATVHVSEFAVEREEEHEGNFFTGLFFAMIIYAVVAVGATGVWELCHLWN